MAVRIDQAGQQGASAAIDFLRRGRFRLVGPDQPLDLAVVAHQQSGEAENPALIIDPDAIDVIDQGRGIGGGGE